MATSGRGTGGPARSAPRVAVLGSGLQGVCAALELARRGVKVALFERDSRPIERTSLRNEGKIHLGLVYAHDPSFRTSDSMLEGAISFRRLLDRWTGGRFSARVSRSHPFQYLVAHDTLVGVEELAAHYARVEERFRERLVDDPDLDYLGTRPDRLSRRLTLEELSAGSRAVVTAGFATAELAIDLPAMATVLREAVAGCPRVVFRPRHTIRSVVRHASAFTVTGSSPAGAFSERYEQVVNALWDGRLVVDDTLGILPPRPWVHRLKYRVLVHLPDSLRARASATFVLGPYGDVVVHPDGVGYVSWYPRCMVGWSADPAPPEEWGAACRGQPDRGIAIEIARRTLEDADAWFPGIGVAKPFAVDAGVIFAWGESDIDDPDSELHHRDATGVYSEHGYHTVNTGKLTTAPRFAVTVADHVLRSG